MDATGCPFSSTRMAAIRTGDIDIANRLTAEQVEVLEGEEGLEVLSYLNDRVYYVAFKNIGAGEGSPIEDRQVGVAEFPPHVLGGESQ